MEFGDPNLEKWGQLKTIMVIHVHSRTVPQHFMKNLRKMKTAFGNIDIYSLKYLRHFVQRV